MKSVYRYREERHIAQPPETVWPFVADSARVNELVGSPMFRVEERPDAQGRIHRYASAGLGPIRLKWEEGYGEWEENRRLVQVRNFINGPMRRFQATTELFPEGNGSRLVVSAEIECAGVLGWLEHDILGLNRLGIPKSVGF